MALPKQKQMSREQAAELYRDLKKNMAQVKSGKSAPKGIAANASTQDIAKEIAKSISQSMARDPQPEIASSPFAITAMTGTPDRNALAAIAFLVFVAVIKLGLSLVESSGAIRIENAQASVVAVAAGSNQSSQYGREEIRILTALDTRRAELEERSRKTEEKELELSRRDKEFVTKLVQLKELTEKLKMEREKDEKKRDTQLDQLANVYGSMAPQEAAALMEQLDITIALSLLERMPEKRIGQILALMTPARALAVTKLLSGKNS